MRRRVVHHRRIAQVARTLIRHLRWRTVVRRHAAAPRAGLRWLRALLVDRLDFEHFVEQDQSRFRVSRLAGLLVGSKVDVGESFAAVMTHFDHNFAESRELSV